MPEIVEIYNPNVPGQLMVSSGMLNFVCRRSGVDQSVAKVGGNTNPSSILVDVSGITQPLVVLQSLDTSCALFRRTGNTFEAACGGAVGSWYAYYIFDWTLSLPPHEAEFKVYDPNNGNLTFSSRYWPLKIPTLLTGGSSQQYDAPGKKLGFAHAGFGGRGLTSGAYCLRNGQAGNIDDGYANCADVRAKIDGKLYGGTTLNGDSSVKASVTSFDDVTASFGSTAEYDAYAPGWEVINKIMVVDVTGIPLPAAGAGPINFF